MLAARRLLLARGAGRKAPLRLTAAGVRWSSSPSPSGTGGRVTREAVARELKEILKFVVGVRQSVPTTWYSDGEETW